MTITKNGNGHNGTYTAGQFIEAIPGTGGIISTIAGRVGCAWHTVKNAIARWPTVAQAYEDERQKIGDLLESTAIKVAKKGDGPMLRYFLSTVYKDRGVTERREITGKDGGPIEIKRAEDLTDDELAAIIAGTSATILTENSGADDSEAPDGAP